MKSYIKISLFSLKRKTGCDTIAPSCGFNCLKNRAVVWGHENDFEEALVVGTWNKVVKWFLENN